VSAIVERARERVEEIKAKGAMAVVEERFPKIKEIRGGGGGGGGILGGGSSPEIPTIKEVREKGILTVLEERFPKVKEIRERGILARITKPKEGGPTPSPAGKSPPLIEEKEVKIRGARILQ